MSSNNLYLYQWYQNGLPFFLQIVFHGSAASGIYQLQITTNSCTILSNDISFQSNVNIDESHEDISVNISKSLKNQAVDLSKFQSNKLQIYI